MKFHYMNRQGKLASIEATMWPDNPHCAVDALHRTWLQYEDNRWRTQGIPKSHGGKNNDDTAANATRVEP